MDTRFEKKVLSIHAHPDDAEIFCAGTLGLLREKGYAVAIVAITGGQLGGIGMSKRTTAAVRKQEAERSAREIDAGFQTLGEPDGFLMDTKRTRVRVLDLIRRENPGVIVTHLPFDYHADHRAASAIVEIATMLSTLPLAGKCRPVAHTPLLYHSSPLRNRDNMGRPVPKPDFIVDVSTLIGLKRRMIECHRSQMDLMRKMHGMTDFAAEMLEQSRLIGSLAGVEYGEAFWQHTGGGFPEEPVLQEALKDSITVIG